MILFKNIAALTVFIDSQKEKGASVGFVPTMGALHAGHISLIHNSRLQHQVTVSSIFVNPTQFNEAADFEKYPVTLEKDINLLEKNGCDVLFLPSVQEIYPDGLTNLEHYDLGYLETILEGKYRPGHFQGVCQVVYRLLTAVQPHVLYLGQKDYQQCMVIKKLIALTQLKIGVTIGPTLREPDGLAMSSRNMRLTQAERKQAVKISETLQFIKNEIKPGYIGDLTTRAFQYLLAEGFKPDYIAVATKDNLELLETWDGKQQIVALAAAYLNEVRLIDNMLLN
jgi:pantoate--beta-alanine ligase